MCVRIMVHNCRTQHRMVLIIFPPNLLTIVVALMLSIRGTTSHWRPSLSWLSTLQSAYRCYRCYYYCMVWIQCIEISC